MHRHALYGSTPCAIGVSSQVEVASILGCRTFTFPWHASLPAEDLFQRGPEFLAEPAVDDKVDGGF